MTGKTKEEKESDPRRKRIMISQGDQDYPKTEGDRVPRGLEGP